MLNGTVPGNPSAGPGHGISSIGILKPRCVGFLSSLHKSGAPSVGLMKVNAASEGRTSQQATVRRERWPVIYQSVIRTHQQFMRLNQLGLGLGWIRTPSLSTVNISSNNRTCLHGRRDERGLLSMGPSASGPPGPAGTQP